MDADVGSLVPAVVIAAFLTGLLLLVPMRAYCKRLAEGVRTDTDAALRRRLRVRRPATNTH